MLVLLIFSAFGVCALLLSLTACMLLPLRGDGLTLICRIGDGFALEQRIRAYRLLLRLGLLDVPLTLDLRGASKQARDLAERLAGIYNYNIVTGGEI